MSVIVQTVAGWLQAPILVYGAYTVLYGHLGPGGGFAGGVMIATGLTLATLARGTRPGGKGAMAALASSGALLFLSAACLGAVTVNSFFRNVVPTAPTHHFTLLSGGLIPVYEVGIALLVSGGLCAAISALDGVQRRKPSAGQSREGT